MRRLPAQQRSREKVQRILAAAEYLLGTIGYENAVASPTPLLEQAEVSRGAFYAYFTSPEMAMETVALGYIERSTEMADEFAARSYVSWRELVEYTIDTYHDYYRTPAVRELWLHGHLSPVAVAGDERANLYIATQLRTALQVVEPDRSAAIEIHHCSVAIEIMDYLMRFAFRHNPEGDTQLMAEVRTAVVAYLGSHIEH
jgi:AcrR family transcriptional regulator